MHKKIFDKIELLDIALLNDKKKLKEIDRWLKVLNWLNGWHYDLDIIWVLKNIEAMELPRGSVIVDAGAGLGVTQFILAAKGYNVISLDFGKRQIPKFTRGIFDIEEINRLPSDYRHQYLDFISYGQDEKNPMFFKRMVMNLINPAKVIDHLRHIRGDLFNIKNMLVKRFNIHYFIERLRDHGSFGKILFLRTNFNNTTLDDNIADALVSVSAFEHNTYEDMPLSIKEFERILKDGSSMFITTSAAQSKDWYFEVCKSWNFTLSTLSKWFNIDKENVSYDFNETFRRIKSSRLLKKRISAYYKYSGNNALPYGKIENAKYLPVGVIKFKANKKRVIK